jgi:hypothetical protein
MNLLTQKRPQSELMQLLESTPPPSFKYLPDAEYQRHMDKIADYNFATRVDAYGRETCLHLASGFTYVIPYLDRYVMDMKKCLITDQDLERHYKVWDALPDHYRNKIRKERDRHNNKVEKGLKQLQDFANHQSRHLGKMDEEHQDLLMALEPSEIEVKISSDLAYYIEPAPLEDKYLMTPKEVSRYLIQQSKGMIYEDAIETSRKLRDRGFTQSEYSTAFFVRIK